MHLLHHLQISVFRRKPLSIACTWGGVLALWAIGCLPDAPGEAGEKGKPMNTLRIQKDRFGAHGRRSGRDRYTLRNAHGMTVRLITYGATVTESLVPDRNGKLADVALGFDNLAQYETAEPLFRRTAGRVAFRITEGKFTLDGKPYHLTINARRTILHGGTKGLSKVVWHAEPWRIPPAGREVHASQPGRRPRLSGQSRRDRGLHADDEND